MGLLRFSGAGLSSLQVFAVAPRTQSLLSQCGRPCVKMSSTVGIRLALTVVYAYQAALLLILP